MSFLGADTDELRSAADECLQGKEITDTVIQYLQALIALLKAASFFSGGASAAYAEYLETVVVPWLKKISMALELFAKVLGGNADAQDQASAGESVDPGSIPSYTSQVSGDSTVQPFTGSVLGNGQNAGQAFGAISGAASSMQNSPALGGTGAGTGTGTQVTVTSPDGTVTTVTPGGATTTGPTTAGQDYAYPHATSATTTPTTTTPIVARDNLNALHGDHPASWTAPAGSGAGAGHAALGSGTGGGGASPSFSSGSGLSSGLGAGSVDGSHGSDFSGPTAVHSTGGAGGSTPGADTLATTAPSGGGDPVSAGGNGHSGTSYGTAAGIAGGAGALGLGGAALAAKGSGGTTTGGADGEIDRLGSSNGYGSKGSGVTSLQQRLTDAGYDTQGVDGQWGKNTQAAYDQYRADHPLPVQSGSGYSSPSGFDYNQIKGVRNNPNVTPEFLRAVEGVASRTGAKPEELMGVMSLESNGTFRSGVANPDTHATGLIQFMPKTAQGLGTNIGDLAKMTPTEQLTYVEKYLSQPQYRGRVGTLEGLYSAVLPGHVMGGDEVMFRPGTAAYDANKWLDTDGRGGISVQEAVQQVRIRMGQGAAAR
ncbi:hypothetical protein G5V58_04805 [Nocardioides anomalus]|uniref:Transglycosylase SLT domain-containing protein n=1 Tax=Nocardioides anomalus TaxID=2712223 RepID=A0A6G6WAB8_9ACTN|nr:hypothetical protein [Nocardioides anomalus]QIG42174.1 hypothetical protein G5V58_04805 [Nocardioides anomalus]